MLEKFENILTEVDIEIFAVDPTIEEWKNSGHM